LFVCWFVCFTVGAVLMVHNGTAVHQTCAEATALFSITIVPQQL